MGQYVMRRLILILPSAILVSLFIFLLLRVVPGSRIDLIVSQLESAGVFHEGQREQIAKELGLDRPIHVQYLSWLKGAVVFDFGHSLKYRNTPIIQIIQENVPRTLQVTLLALVGGVGFGILLGLIAGINQNTWIDSAIRVVSVLGLGLPSFVMAVLLYYLLIRYFEWIPPARFVNIWESPQGVLNLFWPVSIMVVHMAAPIARLTRSQFLEVYREDYIRTARAKGLIEGVIVYRHALRNALLPIVTVAGAMFARLLGGVVVIEQVFGITGLSTALIDGIHGRDYPVVQSVLWMVALLVIMVNLLVDLAYGVIDPRVRYS